MLKELDPNASEDAKNAIVASLDEKIANSISDEESQFYKSSKAYALSTFSNNGGALTELESLADEYRASKKFTDVARSYYTMSYLSEQSGDLASALKYAKNALAVIDEAKNDPEKPRTVAGAELYQSRINELEGKQQ